MNDEHLLNNYFEQLHIHNHVILNQRYEAGTYVIPSFWRKHRDVKKLVRRHAVSKWQRPALDPGLISELALFIGE